MIKTAPRRCPANTSESEPRHMVLERNSRAALESSVSSPGDVANCEVVEAGTSTPGKILSRTTT